MLDLVNLNGYTDRAVDELSGGEQQRVALARTLAPSPRLVLLDEPLANLDPISAARLLAILRGLADRGEAVIIVEHRVEEALALRPDRVLYLDAGATRYLGPVDGFLRIADPRAVKLPFDVVLERARAGELTAAPALVDRQAPRPSTTDRAAPPTGTNGRQAPPPSGDGVDHAPAEAPRLVFEAVDASIGDHQILHGVQASLGRREVVAILGPNGSGKTTAFRTAMQLLPVTAGRILVDGIDAAGRGTADLATVFGYVFQSPSQMLFARTVREELAFGPVNLHRDPARLDALIADCLRRTALDGLEGIEERPPLSLSFGQQKRLALAIALALEPATLILDEPSAGQDHQTAEAFMREVLAIPGLESTYFITHDVDLALTHADRILLFRDGRIVADGPPKEVIVDQARWRACNLTPTSLMQANARWGGRDDRFLDAESLALRIAQSERTAPAGTEGGSTSALRD
jgi:energy-coupling factor transport system ATP-binding protein